MTWRRFPNEELQGPDRKQWPTTLGEARALIQATFDKQGPGGWDARGIRFYMNSKGVRPQLVSKLGIDDCRKLLGHMKQARMIIFEEETVKAAA